MKRVLVTGCPRSGTCFVASALTALGVYTTHEGVFSPELLDEGWTWPDRTKCGPWTGESSWMAVPYLAELRREYGDDLIVVHVERDKRAVVESLVATRFMVDDPLSANRPCLRFLYERWPELWETEDPVARATRFVRGWTARMTNEADVRLRLSDPLEGVENLLLRLGERRPWGLVPMTLEYWASRRPNHR